MPVLRLRPARHTRGFTLIELIVAIVVIGILAALAAPTFRAQIASSRDAVLARELEAVGRATAALAALEGSLQVAQLQQTVAATSSASDTPSSGPRWTVAPDAAAGEPADGVLYATAGNGYLGVATTAAHRPNGVAYLLVGWDGGIARVAVGDVLDDSFTGGRVSGDAALCFYGVGHDCAAGEGALSDARALPSPAHGQPSVPSTGPPAEGPPAEAPPADEPPLVSYTGPWQTLPQQLTNSAQVSAATVDAQGRIYSIGGHGSAAGRIVERFDPTNPSAGWTTLPQQLPHDRYGIGAVTGNDGRIYAIGGTDASLNRLRTVVRFDPANPAAGWGSIPQLNTARGFVTAAVDLDGRIYAIGGFDGTARLRTVERFDPANPSAGWTTLPQQLTVARQQAASVTDPATGVIYIVGGFDGTNRHATIERFDPANPSAGWATLPQQLPTGLTGHGAVIGADGRLHVIGGWDGAARRATTETLDLNDPVAGWGTSPWQLNRARNNHGAILGLDGRIYVVGGTGTTAGGAVDPLRTVEVLTPGP